MKPNTQLFILPAIRRALRSRTGVSCANSPRTMQIARRSPGVLCHLLCGFGLALGAANTAFSQGGKYKVTEVPKPTWATSVLRPAVNYYGTVSANTLKSGAAGPPIVCLKNGPSQVLPTLPNASGANDVGARVSGISDSGLMVGYSPWFNGAHPIDQPARAAYWMRNSNGGYAVRQLDTSSVSGGIGVGTDLGRVWGLSSDGRFILFSGFGSTVVAELKPADAGGLNISRFWQLNSWTGNLGVTSSFGKDIHFQPGLVEGAGTVRVVGRCTDTAGYHHCFLWELGLVNDIEPATQTIKDLGPIEYFATVDGVNGTGEAVGYLKPTSSASYGTYWNENSASFPIPSLAGGVPYSINDYGWVTGFAFSGKQSSRQAILWYPDTNVTSNLNTLKSAGDLSIELTEGVEITNSGHIVCLGLKKGKGVLALASPAP